MSADPALVNAMHEMINDIYMDLVNLDVSSHDGRSKRQTAILRVCRLRRLVEKMGLHHTMVVDDAQ